MVGEPSHVKQLSLNHVCKIGLSFYSSYVSLFIVLGSLCLGLEFNDSEDFPKVRYRIKFKKIIFIIMHKEDPI
jgi:hypothetical protein